MCPVMGFFRVPLLLRTTKHVAQIGPAVLRACSTTEFVASSAEVRRTWSLISDDRAKGISARVHDIVRIRDSEAAAAIGERLSLSDQEGEFAMIRAIVKSSSDPARLEDTLRPLGEKQLATEAKESHVQSLSEALVQAVGEALRGKETLLPHTVAAWDDFLATVWACMMLTGAYECLRRKRESGSIPASEPEGGERFLIRGWRRRGGLLQYSLPRPLREVPAVTVKHGNARDSVVTSLAGVDGSQ